jgi:hypothetical protein
MSTESLAPRPHLCARQKPSRVGKSPRDYLPKVAGQHMPIGGCNFIGQRSNELGKLRQ